MPGSIIPLRGLLLCLGSLVAVLRRRLLWRVITLPGRLLRSAAARSVLLRGIVSLRGLLCLLLRLLRPRILLLLPDIPGQLLL